MDESESTIRIITKEGKELEITKKSAELSELLKQTINDFPNEDKFPLNEIDKKSAEKVKEYLTHFNGNAPPDIEKPLSSNIMKNVTDEWSANFIDKMALDDIINLIVAANYMGINCLLDLCSAKIATYFKDKSEEEKSKIREENKWIEDNI